MHVGARGSVDLLAGAGLPQPLDDWLWGRVGGAASRPRAPILPATRPAARARDPRVGLTRLLTTCGLSGVIATCRRHAAGMPRSVRDGSMCGMQPWGARGSTAYVSVCHANGDGCQGC